MSDPIIILTMLSIHLVISVLIFSALRKRNLQREAQKTF
jgi:hypothetical protein